MYCGRELKANEKCNCRSRNSNNSNNASTSNNSNNSNNPGNSTRFGKKQKKAQKVNFERVNNKTDKNNVFANLKTLFTKFWFDPIYYVSNPGAADKAESLILIFIQGIIFSLIIFFSYNRMSRNLFSVFFNALGFHGISGLKNIGALFVCTLSVTALNFLLYFIITGIFYLESRYIYKANATFWDIAVRFAISTLPTIALGLFGIAISFISMHTVITLLLSGIVSSVILNYEGLKSIWYFSSAKTMYILVTGYLFYFGIAYNVIVSAFA